MPKYAQMTKVIVNGVDVSSHVKRVLIERLPGQAASLANIEFFVDKIETTEDGHMTVTVETRPEEER